MGRHHEWIPIGPVSNLSHLYQHACAASCESLVLFGGAENEKDRSNLTSNVRMINASESYTWNAIEAQTQKYTSPKAITLPNHNILIFGGQLANSIISDQLVLLDIENQELERPVVSGDFPSGRVGHSFVYDPVSSNAFLFGGFDGNKVCVDTFELNPATYAWKNVKTKGTPIDTIYHTANIHANSVYFYGGRTLSDQVNNCVYQFNLESKEWNKIESVNQHEAPKRYGHSAVIVNDYLLVYGGNDSSHSSTTDGFLFHLSLGRWYKLSSELALPAKCAFFSLHVFDKKLVALSSTGCWLFEYGAFCEQLPKLLIDLSDVTANANVTIEASQLRSVGEQLNSVWDTLQHSPLITDRTSPLYSQLTAQFQALSSSYLSLLHPDKPRSSSTLPSSSSSSSTTTTSSGGSRIKKPRSKSQSKFRKNRTVSTSVGKPTSSRTKTNSAGESNTGSTGSLGVAGASFPTGQSRIAVVDGQRRQTSLDRIGSLPNVRNLISPREADGPISPLSVPVKPRAPNSARTPSVDSVVQSAPFGLPKVKEAEDIMTMRDSENSGGSSSSGSNENVPSLMSKSRAGRPLPALPPKRVKALTTSEHSVTTSTDSATSSAASSPFSTPTHSESDTFENHTPTRSLTQSQSELSASSTPVPTTTNITTTNSSNNNSPILTKSVSLAPSSSEVDGKSPRAVMGSLEQFAKSGPVWKRKKKKKILTQWKQRYFHLKGDRISYYTNVTDVKPLGEISLMMTQVKRLTESQLSRGKGDSQHKRFALELVTIDSQYHIATETEEDLEQWLYIINQVKLFIFQNGLEPKVSPVGFKQKKTLFSSLRQKKHSAASDSGFSLSRTPDGSQIQHSETPRSQIESVLKEIIETERDYVEDLRIISQHYIGKLEDYGLLQKDQKDAMFGNAEELYPLHADFLARLESAFKSDKPDFALVFEQFTPKFSVYSHYCSSQSSAVETIRSYANENPNFGLCLDELKTHPECHNLDIYNYVIKPMQRLCKYPLLLRELWRAMEESDEQWERTKRAYEGVAECVGKINESKRVVDSLVQIVAIQDMIIDKELNLMSTKRQFVVENEFRKVSFDNGKEFTKARIWLFNDIILVAKKKAESKYNFKYMLSTDQIVVWDLDPTGTGPPEKRNGFSVVPVDKTKDLEKLVILASTQAEKTEWINAINSAIGSLL